MKEPLYNDFFPMSEYADRIARIRSRFPAHGLDAVFLAGQANVDYSSGFLHGTWMHGFGEGKQQVLISADAEREPILIVPDGLRGCIDTTALSDVRIATDLVYGENLKDIVAAFTECGLTKARVGMEIHRGERMGFTLPFYRLMLEALPDIEWVDCTDLMYDVRMVKSPREVEKMRFASKITCEAMETGLHALHEGMSERELANIIAVDMAVRSGEAFTNNPWFIFVHADGRSPVGWDGIPSSYRFQKGDCIYVDAGFRYHGYTADMIRVGSIGKPVEYKAKNYYAARDANMKLISFLRPGITAGDAYRYLNSVLREAGYAKETGAARELGFLYEGHGIGLSVHEPPVIHPDTGIVIQPGMVMSIEGNVFDGLPFDRTRSALKNEENILITGTGCELLSKLSNDIWVTNR